MILLPSDSTCLKPSLYGPVSTRVVNFPPLSSPFFYATTLGQWWILSKMITHIFLEVDRGGNSHWGCWLCTTLQVGRSRGTFRTNNFTEHFDPTCKFKVDHEQATGSIEHQYVAGSSKMPGASCSWENGEATNCIAIMLKHIWGILRSQSLGGAQVAL